MREKLYEFFNVHFNVLILVTLFLIVLSVFLHVVHHTQDTSVLNWMEHMDDQILAALLGMMTGYALAKGQPPTPPEPPKP